MKILIAGSHGMIGSAVTRHMIECGREVVRLVRSTPSPDEVWWDPDAGKIGTSGPRRLRWCDQPRHHALALPMDPKNQGKTPRQSCGDLPPAVEVIGSVCTKAAGSYLCLRHWGLSIIWRRHPYRRYTSLAPASYRPWISMGRLQLQPPRQWAFVLCIYGSRR